MSDKILSRPCMTLFLSGVLLAVLGIATPLFADPPSWAPVLEKQLQNEKSCKVLYIINVKEYRLLNHDIVEARVNCDDGRSFDVVRRGKQLPFDIDACKPTVC